MLIHLLLTPQPAQSLQHKNLTLSPPHLSHSQNPSMSTWLLRQIPALSVARKAPCGWAPSYRSASFHTRPRPQQPFSGPWAGHSVPTRALQVLSPLRRTWLPSLLHTVNLQNLSHRSSVSVTFSEKSFLTSLSRQIPSLCPLVSEPLPSLPTRILLAFTSSHQQLLPADTCALRPMAFVCPWEHPDPHTGWYPERLERQARARAGRLWGP